MTEMICMGPQLLQTKECLIATLGSIFFIITLISIDYCNCGSIKCPLVLERNHFGKILWCLYHSRLKYIQYGIQCMSEVCCNKEHILKYHMILWQRWDHGSSSVANYQIINCRFEHSINYCDFFMIVTDKLSLCKSNFVKSLITAAHHQCNIFSNHFTYPPSTSRHHHRLWPSPSITNIIIITIIIMVFLITLSILQWIILYSMLCVPSLWVYVIVFKHIPS